MPVTLPEGREKLFDTIDAAKKEHEANGTFARGNRGGPGNPFARQVGMLRSAMLDAVQPEDLQHIMRVLIAMAGAGDLAAARLVLQYTIGKPAAAPDPDRADLDEAKMHLEGSTKPADVEAMLRSMPPNFVNVMAEEVRPIVLQKNYEEAERRAADEAADRARREAEMTAEEDAWEAAEKAAAAAGPRSTSRQQTATESTHLAPRDDESHGFVAPEVGRREHLAERDECARPPSANGNFREPAPSTNGPVPSTNATFEQILQGWAHDRDTASPPR